MSTNRLFHCVVLLSVFGLVGVDARAQPRLLIEIHDIGGGTNISHVGAPIYMAFKANGGNGDPPIAILEGSYDSDDVGVTFDATPENVEAFEAALSLATGEFSIITSNTSPTGGRADGLWQSDSRGFFRQFVPRLGVGLTGYHLTALTQTIDRIQYFPGITVNSQQEQTIRIYGQAIPEPSSIASLVFLHGLVVSFHRTRTGTLSRCRYCRAPRAHRR
jgi:hypothetical protein